MKYVDTKGRFSFPGGIHPLEKKDLTCEVQIQPGPAVKEVAVMLSQHIGAVCQPLNRKGDAVQAGQKIGDCDAFVSAPVHSPITGKVKEIALRSHAVLGRSPAIFVAGSSRTISSTTPPKRASCARPEWPAPKPWAAWKC